MENIETTGKMSAKRRRRVESDDAELPKTAPWRNTVTRIVPDNQRQKSEKRHARLRPLARRNMLMTMIVLFRKRNRTLLLHEYCASR